MITIDKHGKEIRWYGIYANSVRKKLQMIKRATWASAIVNSFQKDPEICPRCETVMVARTFFSFFAFAELKRLWRIHACVKGYFISYRNDP